MNTQNHSDSWCLVDFRFSRGFRAVVRGVRPPPSTTAFASFSQVSHPPHTVGLLVPRFIAVGPLLIAWGGMHVQTSRPRRKMRGGGAAEVQNNQAPPVPPPVTQQEHSAQRMPEEMFAQIIQNTTLKVQTAVDRTFVLVLSFSPHTLFLSLKAWPR